MNAMTEELTAPVAGGVTGRNSTGLVFVFAATVLLSAFLLFQVQPLISKTILPWFGGGPAVWTTCMLFFQVVLFCGYAYAHLIHSRLTPRSQGLCHALLLTAAICLLPISPSVYWKPADGNEPTWRIMQLLAVTVGLPYFALSATGPLLQAWFNGAHKSGSAYRLYALSNLGSLLGLLTYPFVVEPGIDLPRQAALWSAVFVVFAVLCGWCALALVRRPGESSKRGRDAESAPAASDIEPEPRFWRRLAWLALPACASLMLLATTNHLCQDVAVFPFLWVVPLSLYLLTFIVCFDHERWYIRPLFCLLSAVALLGVVDAWNVDLLMRKQFHLINGLSNSLLLYFVTLFSVCMVFHGELARSRPAPRHVTEFYLFVAAGGALGGVFVSLVAPHLFSTFFEWNIGLALSYLMATAVGVWGCSSQWLSPRVLRLQLALFLSWTAVLLPAAVFLSRDALQSYAKPAIALYCLSASMVGAWYLWTTLGPRQFRVEGKFFLVGIVLFPLAAFGLLWFNPWSVQGSPLVTIARNFYGVVYVVEHEEQDPQLHQFVLKNGRIVHGAQFAQPDRRREPGSYYSASSGVGRVIRFYEDRDDLRVGVIGLGVGTVATYGRAGQLFRFYEINPNVTRIAEKYFTYLGDLRSRGGECQIVPGDGRLSLEREIPQNFQVLVLDAFSGDAIPTHLLTREAFDIYLRHLAKDGVLAVHVSNLFFDIYPVVAKLAEHFEFGLTEIVSGNARSRGSIELPSDWILLTRNKAFLEATPPQLSGMRHKAREVHLWTDDYSNLLEVLK
jgi:hypothetical protein